MQRPAELVTRAGERHDFLDRLGHSVKPRLCRSEPSHSKVSERNDGGTDRCTLGSFQKGKVVTRFATTELFEVTVWSAGIVLNHSVGMLNCPIFESRSRASNASINGPDSPNPFTLTVSPRLASAISSERSRSILPKAT